MHIIDTNNEVNRRYISPKPSVNITIKRNTSITDIRTMKTNKSFLNTRCNEISLIVSALYSVSNLRISFGEFFTINVSVIQLYIIVSSNVRILIENNES